MYNKENKKCFLKKNALNSTKKDAFKTENREYKKEDWSFEYVLVQELPLVEVGDCYFVKTMSSLKHRSYA